MDVAVPWSVSYIEYFRVGLDRKHFFSNGLDYFCMTWKSQPTCRGEVSLFRQAPVKPAAGFFTALWKWRHSTHIKCSFSYWSESTKYLFHYFTESLLKILDFLNTCLSKSEHYLLPQCYLYVYASVVKFVFINGKISSYISTPLNLGFYSWPKLCLH